jgi:peptide/nickel transport system permease protein
MSHAAIVRARIAKSRRVLLGTVILGTLALIGIFAEALAGDAPVIAIGPSGITVFPAIAHAAEYDALEPSAIAARFEGHHAIWPLVRAGPTWPTLAGPLAPFSLAHPLGTDLSGRDVAARLIYGARTALGLSLGAVLLSMFLGVALGSMAGHYRGFWNDRLVRLVEMVDTFPSIIVVAIVRAIEREPSSLSLVIAVALVRWAEVARLVRAEVLRASAEDYVLAARALGARPARVLVRHILPNAMGPVMVSSVFGIASVVLLEAAVSFLGMGSPEKGASWGEVLAEGARQPSDLRLIIGPGFLLLLTVGGSYLMADALRDALDPRRPRLEGPRAGRVGPGRERDEVLRTRV